MADGHVVTDDERRAVGLVRRLVGHMPHGQVLNVAATPDLDAVHIAAQHRVAPDGAVIADPHIADDLAGGVQIDADAESGGGIEIVGEWHGRMNLGLSVAPVSGSATIV